MHKVKIVSKKGRTHIFVDGKDMSHRCMDYTIHQEGTDGPYLSMTLSVDEMEVDMEDVKIAVPAGTDTAERKITE